ncbi:MAG: Spy/CpxP family protein refolding chaperone [Bacteroidetes bacterium]|nr:Spy/CpxP family protein refolding chaperone [Bacteroidota bacterium]
MNTRNIKFAGALLFGILMITTVNAQSPRQGGRGLGPCGAGEGPGYGRGLNQSEFVQSGRAGQFARLDLSEEQQAEITSLRTEHYKEITPLRNKMAELKARERTLLSEESVDMKAVNKTIDEQTDLMNKMRKLQTKHQVAVKSNLTDEQLMQVQQRRQFARHDGFHGKSGRRGGKGGGGTGTGRGYRGI